MFLFIQVVKDFALFSGCSMAVLIKPRVPVTYCAVCMTQSAKLLDSKLERSCCGVNVCKMVHFLAKLLSNWDWEQRSAMV